METRADVLLESIKTYFASHSKELQLLTNYLAQPATKISLRAIDWLVTNYAQKHNVAYLFTDPATGEQRIFNVFLEYKSQLKSFSKTLFDPFRRKHPKLGVTHTTFVDANGDYFETTVGQLNFFRWAIRHRVVEYTLQHLRDIDDDMERTKSSKRKRIEPPSSRPVPVESPAITQPKRTYLTHQQPCSTTLLRVRFTFT